MLFGTGNQLICVKENDYYHQLYYVASSIYPIFFPMLPVQEEDISVAFLSTIFISSSSRFA